MIYVSLFSLLAGVNDAEPEKLLFAAGQCELIDILCIVLSEHKDETPPFAS